MRRSVASSILILLPLLAACVCTDVAAEDEYTADERSHWSLQKRSVPVTPQFENAADQAWIRNPIDAFVLKALRDNGLRPAAEADRRTLARRLYFNLIGLPPTPAEIDAFVNDAAPGAC